ncbi:MAG: hypothetical protein KC501_02835 [Myxococcales bacterium]|nr:hypothetical protein [Myxococcales bacterium]
MSTSLGCVQPPEVRETVTLGSGGSGTSSPTSAEVTGSDDADGSGSSGGVVDDTGPDPSTTSDTDEPPPTSDNRFGIGLVAPGSASQLDLTAELTGPGGWVRLTFAGIDTGMHDAPPDWKDAVSMAHARDLVPVIRLGPPWGDRRVRNQSDDPGHLAYGGLAQAYADTVASLPQRDGWPMVIEVHNEPNLCYEWACDPGDGNDGWLAYGQAAAEYAHMLSDVANALHGLGDARIMVMNGGLAPGGTVSCECGGEGFDPGITSVEYVQAMRTAVPDLFARLDAWASHSYPANGLGYGFFVGYEAPGWDAETGLLYYQHELTAIGTSLPVIITETGWTVSPAAGGPGNRDAVATWTRSAYERVWLVEPEILAVLPFMLQDPSWDDFAWVAGDGSHYPVFDTVRDYRCSMGGC